MLNELLSKDELNLLFDATNEHIKNMPSGLVQSAKVILSWTHYQLKKREINDPSLKILVDNITEHTTYGKFSIFLDLNFVSGMTIGHTTLPGKLGKKDMLTYIKR